MINFMQRYKFLTLEDTAQTGDEWLIRDSDEYEKIIEPTLGKKIKNFSGINKWFNIWKIRRPIKRQNIG